MNRRSYSNDVPVCQGEEERRGAANTQAEQTLLQSPVMSVIDTFWERSEQWAFAAQHIRPEPITLSDMALEEDAMVDYQQSGLASDVSSKPGYTYLGHISRAQVTLPNRSLLSLAWAMWTVLHSVGKIWQIV